MKFRIDPFAFRLALGLFCVPAAALACIGLAKLKERADDRRVVDYVRHVQPELAADPRFKYVKLEGAHVSGCVSNSEVLASLKSFLEASKPPVPVSFSLVSTNADDLAEREDHERLMQLQSQALNLEARADAIFTTEGPSTHDGIWFSRPKGLAPAKELTELSDFQAVLAPVTNRTLAVISTYAVGFDTNRLRNAASHLRECGFKEVRTTVMGWGMKFPGPVL